MGGPSYPVKLVLAFRNGDRCAFPGCSKTLTIDGKKADPVVIGEAAHIAGENEGAARYDALMTDEQRNHYNNLIYLCRSCHAQIDKQEKDFSVSRLHEIKADHERKVQEKIAEAFAEVGFLELELVTKWILHESPKSSSINFSVTPPEDKLRKNELTSSSRHILTMGLSVAREVKSFVEGLSQTDADFPEKLKIGFLNEYYRYKKDGHKGDELFELMCSFAQRGFKKEVEKSAGIAVLSYLFETCEVFEK